MKIDTKYLIMPVETRVGGGIHIHGTKHMMWKFERVDRFKFAVSGFKITPDRVLKHLLDEGKNYGDTH